jgi:hypothetical protein
MSSRTVAGVDRGRLKMPPSPLELVLLDMEPALAASLGMLLSSYPEFHLHNLTNLDYYGGVREPDIVLVTPQRASRLGEIRRRFPNTYILGRVPWDRDGYWNHPALDETLDKLASFDVVLATLLRIRRERTLKEASG